ncbi:predicted protein [Pyrenophora tritici-repentis Pt-1C-BFP]|uniref:Uncharacterized protein n=1 Tax=Pyrenophora tritici-repentis (strain Pt-1C-BFP) TaxID=426418 RepID=B2VRV0_PYRTR|nr:uncharacterized protein PTRG_00302 [Pyrenophora tritici-repentis Pt-1C-BFP]EDU39740.1 predicted protein [Pyrenophora tritici-repentis Pt-1C-BFP]
MSTWVVSAIESRTSSHDAGISMSPWSGYVRDNNLCLDVDSPLQAKRSLTLLSNTIYIPESLPVCKSILRPVSAQRRFEVRAPPGLLKIPDTPTERCCDSIPAGWSRHSRRTPTANDRGGTRLRTSRSRASQRPGTRDGVRTAGWCFADFKPKFP